MWSFELHVEIATIILVSTVGFNTNLCGQFLYRFESSFRENGIIIIVIVFLILDNNNKVLK